MNNETIARGATHLWTEPLFPTGLGLTLLAIGAYEASKWVYGSGMGLRLAGIALAVAGGVVLAIWAVRRTEKGARRSGAFALTWGILGLLGAGAAFLIEQAVQHAMSLAVFGPLATLTMTLVVFGVISLVGGVIKRINA
jgi:FtsH-binding integral membrane protein